MHLLLMENYKQPVEQLYIQPKNKEILGSFLEPNENIDDLPSHPAPENPK